VNVFVVTETTARRHQLTTLSDLADVAAGFKLGGPVECPDRPYCLAGLEAAYGLSFAEFVPNRSLAITAEALIREEVDVGVMFSTAAELTSGPFVVLADDRRLQPAENVVPVVRDAVIDRWGPRLTDTLDGLSRLLTTEQLQAMNRRIRDDESIEAVAASWLREVGIVDA
jgi:osmoprotectant transport system substrate-binding protein